MGADTHREEEATMKLRPGFLSLPVVLAIMAGCGSQPAPGPAGTSAPPAVRAQEPAPPPAPTPQPGLRGQHHEVNSGNFDLVDGIAYTAKDGSGTVVYAVSKPIASATLAGSPCPMTEARSLTSLRNAGWVEVTLDASGKSKYYSAGTAFGGTGREEDVADGRYWTSTLALDSGRAAGRVEHVDKGGFEFNAEVLSPRVTEVSESDKVGGKRSDPEGVTPTEGQIVAAYKKVRAAALKKDLRALLAAQGFDEKQIAAIRGLEGIDADLAVYADRFLKPGTTGEFQGYPGYGAVTGEGVNSKKKKFINVYWFTPCEGRLVLTNIYENEQ
jgi:hypothetical protein